jgi:DNA helicase-2/ATP-dependent DNA helicase PcrA
VKIFHLEQNYRSTQKILDTAFSVISKNTSHPILKLWTQNEEGARIVAYQAKNEIDESDFIVSMINEMMELNSGLSFNDYAVLYRTNAQSRVVEEAFLRSEVPYILIGGVRFYERKEIKDLISYLRLLINIKDSISFKRAEKIGKKRLNDFLSYRDNFESNNWITSLSSLNLLDDVIKSTRYLELFNSDLEEDSQRLENIKELKSVASEFPNLNSFLENISLVESEYMPDSPIENTEKKNAVTLMTLHAAKGLEFKNVFMIGMEEGLFPHSRTLMEPTELEEERRLCYVGITRAKQKLFLTFAARRLYFGQRNSNMVSRFVLDIPENLYTLTIAKDNIV